MGEMQINGVDLAEYVNECCVSADLGDIGEVHKARPRQAVKRRRRMGIVLEGEFCKGIIKLQRVNSRPMTYVIGNLNGHVERGNTAMMKW